MFDLRYAEPEDAPGIVRIKKAVWPHEKADTAAIAAALAEPGRATLVADEDEGISGFVDGFLTVGVDDSRRWELDLLAVHPLAQRRGIGRALVAACTEAGRDHEAECVRALIRTDNVASQETVARCGYAPDPAPCSLWVAQHGEDDGHPVPPGAHLIPVVTLNYRGVWVEGALSVDAFRAARAMRARHGWDTAGAVIRLDNAAGLEAALEAGFMAVGDYRWWVKTL